MFTLKSIHPERTIRRALLTGLASLLTVAASGCGGGATQQFFAWMPKTEYFAVKEITTTTTTRTVGLDLLWVVDNSGSMGDEQTKIANGFAAFANKYLTKNNDIRIAVITTDAFMAGDPSTPSDRYGANNGANYARLLPGIHDGLRPPVNTGTRSGRPILTTTPPAGTNADNAFFNKLVSDFMINVKPGTSGSGDERGLQSVVKLIEDNEKRSECQSSQPDASCFFRKDVVRGIIFVSDEDDASRFSGATTQAAVVSHAKQYLDGFFRGLDGADSSESPNYFAMGIINPTLLAGNTCNPVICLGDTLVSSTENIITFNPVAQQGNSCGGSVCYWGKQDSSFIDLMKADGANTLAKFSTVKDINSASYDDILDTIGQTILDSTVSVRTYTEYTLNRAPDMSAPIQVQIVHADDTRTELGAGDFSIEGLVIKILIPGYAEGAAAGDRIEVTYTPLSAY